MKLVVFTLMLDAMPFATWHLPIFQKLKCDWKWIIVEGAAQNNGSTRWCQAQEPRHSIDGTLEYLSEIDGMNGVQLITRSDWESKDNMVNAALQNIREPCVLMEIDADEIWKPEAIETVVERFENEGGLGAIKMPCRYFVGPKLICVGKNCWSNKDSEWLRAWRFEPGMAFIKHEPPVMSKLLGRTMDREESAGHGLTFDHLAYVTGAQVAYKEQFYGYTGVLNQWRALQRNTFWPAKLSRFFSFEMHGDAPIVRKFD